MELVLSHSRGIGSESVATVVGDMARAAGDPPYQPSYNNHRTFRTHELVVIVGGCCAVDAGEAARLHELRMELATLRPSALKARALDMGIGHEALSEADDALDLQQV